MARDKNYFRSQFVETIEISTSLWHITGVVVFHDNTSKRPKYCHLLLVLRKTTVFH